MSTGSSTGSRSSEEKGSRASYLGGLFGAFLLGALAGTQVAGLLFFLNPHLPFAPLSVLSGAAFYGLTLGTASLLLAAPLVRRVAVRVERWLPIYLTAVLAASGLGAWVHASYFSFYLPPGINRRLLKAAIWLSLAALICFYTTLIHRIRRRPLGHRSQFLLGFVALASVYVVLERREAFRPTLPATPRPTTVQDSQRPQLYVVGIESATLDAILPLEEQGRLPFFSKMLREGSHARLSAFRPTRREALWTTLATGKFPYRHGVVSHRTFNAPFLSGEDYLNLLPIGIGFEHWGIWDSGVATTASARRARPLWEILSRLGVATSLVGWPLAGQSDDVSISLADRFFESGGEARFAQPTELIERARLFRTKVDEIDPAIVSRFGNDPPGTVIDALARDLWRKDLSSFLLDNDLQGGSFFVVFPGLAEVSRRYFGGYSAVQFKGPQDTGSESAAQLVGAYYTFLDDLLNQLWDQGDDPRLLVVVSAYGVEGPRGLREARRLLLRQPALEGYFGSDGILMFLGEGIRAGAMLRPAELVDLVPTLLYGLGLPIARDLNGAVITGTFDTGFLARHPLTFLPSYETLTEQGLLEQGETQ